MSVIKIWQYLRTRTQCLRCFRNDLKVPSEKYQQHQAKQHARKVWAVIPACHWRGLQLSCLSDKVPIQDCWMTEFKKRRKAEIVQQLLRFPFAFFITFSIIIRQWGPKYFYLLKYLEVVIFIDGWILVYRKLVTGEKKTSHS